MSNVPHPQKSNRMKFSFYVFTSGSIFPTLPKQPVKELLVPRHYPCIHVILKQTDISHVGTRYKWARQYKCRFLRTCNIKSKCCILLLTIDSDNFGASHYKYLFRILTYRPLKLPKTHRPHIGLKKGGGAKLFKGSYLKNDKDLETKIFCGCSIHP